MNMKLDLLAAAAVATLVASSAGAATITVLGAVQDGDAYTNIIPVSTSGDVNVNVTGSDPNNYSDLYSGTGLVGVTPYNSISTNGSMTYALAGAVGDSFTFIWGTVDTYNFISFGKETVSGSDLLALLEGTGQGTSNVIVRITADSAFSDVTLTSGGNAFEHSFNPPEIAAVPVPAAGLLLAAAMGGLGIARRRRKAA